MIEDELIKKLDGITSDSRFVRPGVGFVAIKGATFNGEDYIDQALEKGAPFVFVSKDHQGGGKKLVKVDNPRKVEAYIASKLYPHQPENIVAVTGTNGKSSVAHFFREICQLTGHKSASIGTLGVVDSSGKKYEGGNLTSPNSIKLHQLINDMEASYLAIEASSHGLVQYRTEMVKLKAAAFTTFSQDHLDYHGTMEEYLEAKLRLFKEVLSEGSCAVLNRGLKCYEQLEEICNSRNIKIIDYGYQANYIKIIGIKQSGPTLKIEFQLQGKSYDAEIGLIGKFQAENIMCALGLAIACGVEEGEVVLSKLTSVPGRMQNVGSKEKTVIVDFAHTPDALEQSLKVAKEITKGKLITVFGCGGDRDKAKRSIMGKVAKEYADVVFVTDDNPRSEDPASIRADILASCDGARNIAGRKLAIEQAIEIMEEGDTLLIAGKGHEKTQILGKEVIEFDEIKIARELANS